MSVIVSAVLWALVTVMALRFRTRPDNSMFWAALLIAVSVSTNINGVYLAVDEVLSGSNFLDLAANCLLLAGVYFLARAIMKGATQLGAATSPPQRGLNVAALLTAATMVGVFPLIDAPTISTTFMLDYGDQPAAAAYSIVQYGYIFAVMVFTLSSCVRNVPHMRKGRFRVGFSIIGAGCLIALVLCVVVIAMDLAHLGQNMTLMRELGYIYDWLYALTIVVLCVGLAVAPVSRLYTSLKLIRQLRCTYPQIRGIWGRTVARQPSLSLVGGPESQMESLAGASEAMAESIHRMTVEIHDWLNFENRSSDELSAADRDILRQAENLCLQSWRKR